MINCNEEQKLWVPEVSFELIDRYKRFDLPSKNELEISLKRESTKFALSQLMRELNLRPSYIREIAFPLYTLEVVTVLSAFLKNKKVLEVGSGRGYLSRLLQERGVDVLSIDSNGGYYYEQLQLENTFSLKHRIGDALPKIRSKYDAIIMSWPDYDTEFANQVIKRIVKGQYLIYQGEGKYGCTGNIQFHENLQRWFIELDEVSLFINRNHVRFAGIHDYWSVLKKV